MSNPFFFLGCRSRSRARTSLQQFSVPIASPDPTIPPLGTPLAPSSVHPIQGCPAIPRQSYLMPHHHHHSFHYIGPAWSARRTTHPTLELASLARDSSVCLDVSASSRLGLCPHRQRNVPFHVEGTQCTRASFPLTYATYRKPAVKSRAASPVVAVIDGCIVVIHWISAKRSSVNRLYSSSSAVARRVTLFWSCSPAARSSPPPDHGH